MLDRLSLADYSRSPIPAEEDVRLQLFIRDMTLSERERQALPPEQGWFLIVYARRMASLAVRRTAEDPIRDGIAALLVEHGRADFNESMDTVALLYDAAIRIGSHPQGLFKELARASSTKLARAISDFPDRPPKDRALDAWGYYPSSDEDGFRYSRRW
jgi:hypothetical protein